MDLKNTKNKIAAKLNKSNVKTFFRKQGIYVLIFLCVAAAGLTALLTWPKEAPVPEETEKDVVLDRGTTLDEELAARRTPLPSPPLSPSPEISPQETAKPATGTKASVKLKKPVEGQIIKAFSGDELVPFPALNMWLTHNGVDIKADKGTAVVAALSGTVTEVSKNDSDGGVVIISHSEKTKTLYAGLGEILVKAGDKVNAGQEIGRIGDMPKELDLSYHLHFEYIVDGVYKDPAKYFE